MLKDFSQPFTLGSTGVYFLLEDVKTGRFICFKSAEDIQDFGEDQAARTLRTTFKGNFSVNHQAKFLYDNGFVVNEIRELIREKQLTFSFVDETPGVENTTVCYYATVDIVGGDIEKHGAILLPFSEFAYLLINSFFANSVVNASLAQLMIQNNLESRGNVR